MCASVFFFFVLLLTQWVFAISFSSLAIPSSSEPAKEVTETVVDSVALKVPVKSDVVEKSSFDVLALLRGSSCPKDIIEVADKYFSICGSVSEELQVERLERWTAPKNLEEVEAIAGASVLDLLRGNADAAADLSEQHMKSIAVCARKVVESLSQNKSKRRALVEVLQRMIGDQEREMGVNDRRMAACETILEAVGEGRDERQRESGANKEVNEALGPHAAGNSADAPSSGAEGPVWKRVKIDS